MKSRPREPLSAAALPPDLAWKQEIVILEDMLYSTRAMVDVNYRLFLEHVIEAKHQELRESLKLRIGGHRQ